MNWAEEYSTGMLEATASAEKLFKLDSVRISYRELIDALAEGSADLILLEMMCDVEYTRLALETAIATDLPACIGFSCQLDSDNEVYRNLALEDALKDVLPGGAAIAAVMHIRTPPIGPRLDTLYVHFSAPLAAYPDSGDFIRPTYNFEDVISPEALISQARSWLYMGVRIFGGCCGLGPGHITLMREMLAQTLPA